MVTDTIHPYPCFVFTVWSDDDSSAYKCGNMYFHEGLSTTAGGPVVSLFVRSVTRRVCFRKNRFHRLPWRKVVPCFSRSSRVCWVAGPTISAEDLFQDFSLRISKCEMRDMGTEQTCSYSPLLWRLAVSTAVAVVSRVLQDPLRT